MNTMSKLAAVALGCAILAGGGTATAGVCQGLSSTWDQFVQGGCGGRGNWWGNWLGDFKRFGTTAHDVGGTDKTVIAAVDSSGAIITGCIAEDTTPGNGFYNYSAWAACMNGVKYLYQAYY